VRSISNLYTRYYQIHEHLIPITHSHKIKERVADDLFCQSSFFYRTE
jgi:hypothetical protein